MRIISSFRDYYDCVQREGQDQTCVWARRLAVEPLASWPFPAAIASFYPTDGDVRVRAHVVGFCGKLYPAVAINKVLLEGEDAPTICYTPAEVDDFVERNFKSRQLDSYRSHNRKHYRWYSRSSIGIGQKDVGKFFAAFTVNRPQHRLFVERQAPVFIARHTRGWRKRHRYTFGDIAFHLNSSRREDSDSAEWTTLKSLGFFRIIDTYTAYQEIQMFLSGVFGAPNPHIPVPDDKTMRDIKGFDKMSFKKEPTKKR